MVLAFTYLSDTKFCFNLRGAVGPRQPNHPEDVEFVQFGFYCLTLPSKNPPAPDELAVYRRVKPGASNFTGQAGDPLFMAIATWQNKGTGTKDGIVSRLIPGHVNYGNGSHSHSRMALHLNVNISDACAAIWPRIDLHQSCPPKLKDAARKIFQPR